MIDGVLIIDKPEGFTSHDVVAKTRRILQMKRVGHTGTLDPFATGVMVVLIGRATRLAQFLDKDQKEYEALVRFGYETDTGDRTGNSKSETQSPKFVSTEQIKSVLPAFRGVITQTPPMYSAKKVGGVKLYELARKGIEIERKAVNVTIYEIEVQSSKLAIQSSETEAQSSDVPIRVVCSAGTYIRTLAEDIGRKIGAGAHLAELRRTRAGRFDLPRAVTLERLQEIADDNAVGEILVSMNEAVAHLPEKRLSQTEISKVKNGVKLEIENENFAVDSPIRLTDEKNDLIAVGLCDAERNFIQPKLVLL